MINFLYLEDLEEAVLLFVGQTQVIIVSARLFFKIVILSTIKLYQILFLFGCHIDAVEQQRALNFELLAFLSSFTSDSK